MSGRDLVEDVGGFVVRDDVSWMGLRRLHALSSAVRAEAVRAAALELAEEEYGELMLELAWDDEAGMRHFTAAWRYCMASYPMVVFTIEKGDVVDAVGRAAVSYRRRTGMWPNRGVVRAALTPEPALTPGPSPDYGGGGREGTDRRGTVGLMEGEVEVGRVRLEEVTWMRAGDVGVFYGE